MSLFLFLFSGECKSKTLPRIHFDTTLSTKQMNDEGKLVNTRNPQLRSTFRLFLLISFMLISVLLSILVRSFV